MIEILAIYKWTLVSGVITSVALALVGSQLAARNESVQSIVISQSASLGVLLGLSVQQLLSHNVEVGITVPIVVGFLIALFFYIVCEKIIEKKMTAKNTYYLSLFTLLMALTYLTISLFPNIESHMLATIFGDLALISDTESQIVALISVVVIVFVSLNWQSLTAWSFEKVTFDTQVVSNSQKVKQRYFIVILLSLLTLSVQMMGLLYTLTCLFFPIVVLGQKTNHYLGLKLSLSLVAGFGSFFGVVFSLWQGNFPTVPCISIFIFLVGFMFLSLQPKKCR